jgi:hypothetical protein
LLHTVSLATIHLSERALAGADLLTANYCLALLAALALYMLVEKPCTNLVMLCLAPPRRPSGQARSGV